MDVQPVTAPAPERRPGHSGQRVAARRRRPSAAQVAAALLTAALLALCVAGLGWRMTGGRWYDVRTPSMGQAAPVGTLLLTRPATLAQVRVGELITFHAPGTGEVYSHRVVATSPAGVRTRGDANPVADPWTLSGSDLIGTVAHRWWGCGWLLRGIPLFALLLACLWLAATVLPGSWRSPVRVFGAAVSVAVVAYRLKPWIGLERLGTSTTADGQSIRVISTGVLPTTATVRHGSHAHLIDGQSVDLPLRATQHAYRVLAGPALSLGWWAVLVAACLLPLLWTLAFGLAPTVGGAEPEVVSAP